MRMMNRRLWFVVTAALLLGGPFVLAAENQAKKARELADQQRRVAAAKAAFIASDSGLQKFFDESVGYVVFPRIGKGGFILAGAHGSGLVFEDGALVGRATLSQATVGAQIGGQVYREVIFFETRDALLAFKQSTVEFSAQVAAVIAAEGASKDARYREGVLVFTDPIKGLMAEASVGGQKFRYTPLDR
jgi:lipid-binding SYLF domain-containing protein